ncbi:MAG: response regulator [Anaerolineae bacterium]|nr:response regulator [Anaerolineae bacterium]
MARILFVDDDQLTLETYEKIVSYFGHQAILVDCGGAALSLVHRDSVDLIIVDHNLPDMNGFELLEHLRANETALEIPMVMVSAAHDIFANRALAAGAKAYYSKPLLTKDLLDIIEEFTTG